MPPTWKIISTYLVVSAMSCAADDIMAGLARSDACAGEATNALEVMDCALSKDSALSSLPAVVTVTVITTVPSTGVKDKPSETLALPTLHKEVDEA